MTGRDRNRMAIMGDILSAAAFGIDTMLALTGDHPVVGDCPEYQAGLRSRFRRRSGRCSRRWSRPTATAAATRSPAARRRCSQGASVAPVYDPIELQINKLRQKVENGAEYIQTQGIFDLETFKRFLDKVDAAGIKTHIMAGIIPLKAAGMARYMNGDMSPASPCRRI